MNCSNLDPPKPLIHELTLEQASKYFPRTVSTPQISFEQFCYERGEGGIQDKALNGICASLFFDCTRKSATDHKYVVQGRKAIQKLEHLKQEYADQLKAGQIKIDVQQIPLDITRRDDRARARMALRRTVQRALKKGLYVPKTNIEMVEQINQQCR